MEKRVVTKCKISKEICFYRCIAFACDFYLYSSVILHNPLIAKMAVMQPWTGIAKQIWCTGTVKFNQNKNKSKLNCVHMSWNVLHLGSGWVCVWSFKKVNKLLNPRALKIASFNVWMRYFLWKLTGTLCNSNKISHTLKDVYFFGAWKYKSS